MKGPLYWLLVSDKDKPTDCRLLRAPIVWLFCIGNAVWGLACMTFTRSQSWAQDAFLVEVVKWVAGILAMSLPTVIIILREAEKGDGKCSFQQFIVAVLLGVFMAVFLGFGLEIILSLLGVRHFLGIPIEKWS